MKVRNWKKKKKCRRSIYEYYINNNKLTIEARVKMVKMHLQRISLKIPPRFISKKFKRPNPSFSFSHYQRSLLISLSLAGSPNPNPRQPANFTKITILLHQQLSSSLLSSISLSIPKQNKKIAEPPFSIFFLIMLGLIKKIFPVCNQ